METYIVSFEINKPYDEWLTHFEQSRPGLKAADIAVLFRGPRKDDASKVCVILQAKEGEVDKFMEANAPMIAESGHVLESTVVEVYKSQRKPKYNQFIKKIILDQGWKWSECLQPAAGGDGCQAGHVGVIIQGIQNLSMHNLDTTQFCGV